MKIIVAGGREFNDYELMKRKLDHLFSRRNNIVVVCGEARGADSLGKRYAQEHGMEVISKPADWDRYGRTAGYRRNMEMGEIADALVAFWDGKSRGTKNMIDIMHDLCKPVRVVRY